MDPSQIYDMITSNREYIKLKNNIALQNLAMLHRSFDTVTDEACILGLTLNDSIAAMIFSADYAGSIDISQRAIGRFPDSPHYYLIAHHQAVMGRCYIFLLENELARDFLQLAEINAAKAERTEETKALHADILHDLAMNNHHAGWDKEASIDYLDRALEVLAGTRYRQRRGICLMGKGNVRFDQDKPEEALQYYMEAEPLLDDKENFTNLSAILCNIGMCYTNLGRLGEAESYLIRALDLRIKVGTYSEIANSHYNIYLFYKIKNDLTKANENLLIARDYALISQTRGLKLLILEELEKLALTMGDKAAADKHHAQYLEVQH